MIDYLIVKLALHKWFLIGMTGQAVFGLRFLVQWIYSERLKKSAFPISFWYLSIIGTLIIFVYSVHIFDWVFMLGSSLNLIVYFRNLVLIYRERKETIKDQDST